MSVIWWLDEQFLGKEELICKTECHVCEYVSNIRTHCATGYCEGKKQIWNIRQLIVCNEFWDSWRGKNMLEVLGKKKRQNYINCFKKSLLLQTWALQNAFLARYTTFHWKFVARFWRAAILLETFQDNGKHMSSWSKNATLRIYILIVFNLNWELIAKSIIFPFSPSVNFYQLLLCCTST